MSLHPRPHSRLSRPPTGASAQSAYVVTKIIDDQTVRPDGRGTFYIGSVDSFPSLDGNTLLFQDIDGTQFSEASGELAGRLVCIVVLADFVQLASAKRGKWAFQRGEAGRFQASELAVRPTLFVHATEIVR